VLPALLRWRRRVQVSRRVPDSELVAPMQARFETALLPSSVALQVHPLMVPYRLVVLRILQAVGR
jgi:hypothetical protein